MPQRFGRYVLLDRMGVGGMAEVYRAVVPGVEGFKRDLVVKKILTAQAQAQNFIDMFVHEARISALLHHPNVVQVFDFGQVDGNYFLAMELLRGRDLLAVLRTLRERKRQMPIPVATHIAHQVALGLGYAHALTSPTGEPLNIIHRDVSPSNIMCLRAGGVKLLDFGIAQAIGEMDEDSDPEGGFKGKLGYMAPERLLNAPQDHRVDLFALGTVMWEMLTGRRLFYGKSDEEKMHLLLEKPVPPPSSVRPEVPPALDAIVAKALERDPEQRYASGQILADDLEVVLSEVKYHSRMLPALLTELFGSSPSAAHMAMSAIPPELLTVEPTPTASPLPARVAESEGETNGGATPGMTPTGAALAEGATTATTAPGVMIRSKRVLLVTAAATMVAIAGVGAALAARSSSRTASELTSQGAGTLEAPVMRPALVVDPPAPEPPIAASDTTPSPGGSAEGSLQPATAKPGRQPAARRAVPGRPTAKVATGRIARGLSIDPFAEAAAPRVTK